MRLSQLLTILGLIGNIAFGLSSSTLSFVPLTHSRTFANSNSFCNHSNIRNMAPCTIAARPALPSKVPRGGAQSAQNSSSNEPSKCPLRKLSVLFASSYGTGGVVYILVKAIRRVFPIAMEPFSKGATPLSQFQLGVYIVTCLWFAYVEGYKGFHTKFAPLVVSRSFTLEPGYSKISHFIFAPFYSMGLFHATKKRMAISWGVTLGVAGIVAAVKRLPYPWRNIVDAGVVTGLSWGCVSIIIYYVKALIVGKIPADPALPKKE